MPQDISALIDLILSLFEGSYRSMRRAVDGLSDEQLYWQPAPHANSIGWLVWHMMRRRDYYSAVFHGEPHVWVTGAWHQRIGRDAEATGMGDTPQEVAAFRPPFGLVLGYAEVCQEAAMDRVARLTGDMLARDYLLDADRGMQLGRNILRPLANDGANRAGQIDYLRGLVSGLGWQAR